MSKHTLVATVEEGSATLNRVLSLFRQRSFAIESLSIGKTNEPGIMRLTMVVDGARSAVEQVTKQLYKVVEVRKVSDLSDDARVERELALVKVSCKTAPQRAEVMQGDLQFRLIFHAHLDRVMVRVQICPWRHHIQCVQDFMHVALLSVRACPTRCGSASSARSRCRRTSATRT